jgi:Fic family protein
MSFEPIFKISSSLLTRIEEVAALRERIQNASIQVTWIPALQKDSRVRNAHSSTAIEGNPLTLEEVRALESHQELATAPSRARREILNYFAALRHIENHASKMKLTHDDMFRLHAIMAGQVMDQGEAGAYRTIRVRVGPHVRVTGVVEHPGVFPVTGSQFSHPSLPLRGYSSFCRWQWSYRSRLGFMGTVSPGFRFQPYIFSR